MLAVSGAIAPVEEAPVGVRGGCAGDVTEGDAGLMHAATLRADILALLLFQRGQEVVEAGEARIAPVELHAVPQQHAGAAQLLGFTGSGKQHMQR